MKIIFYQGNLLSILAVFWKRQVRDTMSGVLSDVKFFCLVEGHFSLRLFGGE